MSNVGLFRCFKEVLVLGIGVLLVSRRNGKILGKARVTIDLIFIFDCLHFLEHCKHYSITIKYNTEYI